MEVKKKVIPLPQKKKFPSQIRYERNNPPIGCRVKREEKVKIEQRAKKTGYSVSQLVRMSVLNQEIDFSKYEKKLTEELYEKAKKDWAIWYYCAGCRRIIYIKPYSDDHNVISKYLRDVEWGHEGCVNKEYFHFKAKGFIDNYIIPAY
jgi:hypothetical protein